jgi:hypothetical protein
MGRLLRSIAKYTRALGVGAAASDAGGSCAGTAVQTGRRAAGAPHPASCQPVPDEPIGKRRRETPERVKRRPLPGLWSKDELLLLHEAVALMWPDGPVTVSKLRNAIAKNELGHVRIAGRIYTSRGALEALAACRTAAPAAGPAIDWESHLATLLRKRGS